MTQTQPIAAKVEARFQEWTDEAMRLKNQNVQMLEALKLVRKTFGGPENWNGETRRFLEATDAAIKAATEG